MTSYVVLLKFSSGVTAMAQNHALAVAGGGLSAFTLTWQIGQALLNRIESGVHRASLVPCPEEPPLQCPEPEVCSVCETCTVPEPFPWLAVLIALVVVFFCGCCGRYCCCSTRSKSVRRAVRRFNNDGTERR